MLLNFAYPSQADKILVVEEGQITECGTHQEPMRRWGGDMPKIVRYLLGGHPYNEEGSGIPVIRRVVGWGCFNHIRARF